MNIKISFVRNNKDNYPNDKTLSFEQLIEITQNFIESSKEEAPGIIGGHFNGKKRIIKNLESRTVLILDVDFYKGSINDLEVLFKRDLEIYRYIAYSTASCSLNEPRIRIILFFNQEVGTDQYQDLARKFIRKLNLDFRKTIQVSSSARPTQIMYLPIKPNEDYIPWHRVNEGKLIDTNEYSDITSNPSTNKDDMLIAVKNTSLEIDDNDIARYLDKYPVEDRDYFEWLEVGTALHHQYRGEDTGLIIWNKWSKKDPRPEKYKGLYELENKWNSFKTDLDSPVTFATIIYKVNSNLPSCKDDKFYPIFKEKWQDTKGKYKTPVFTENNFKILLKEYNISVGYDEIKKFVEVNCNGMKFNDLNHAVTRIKLLCKLNSLETSLVGETTAFFGHQNKYNSWKDWVYSKPWDGIERFGEFCKTVVVDPDHEEIRDLYLKKWFLQLINVTCLNDEGEPKTARVILIFQGKQYAGKTHWFKALVPSEHKDFVSEGVSLKISSDIEILKCIRHVMVELGEISATMKKSDTDEIKNFLTSSKDILNEKYVPYPVTHRRRTVFFGSVNENEFLQDQTGNTRFLCLPVLDCNYQHNFDMQQIYAELLELTKTDNDYYLSADDLIVQQKMNSTFKSISVIEEKLIEVFEIENALTQPKETMTVYNATNLLEELGFNINQMIHKKNLTNEIAKILDSYGLRRCTKPRGWYLPNKRIDIGF